jgi:hypothetical protein
VTTAGSRAASSIIDLPPGQWWPCRNKADRNALLLVARGSIEVRCPGGTRQRFDLNAILTLARLGRCAVYNSETRSAVLVVVRRRFVYRLITWVRQLFARADDSQPPRPS